VKDLAFYEIWMCNVLDSLVVPHPPLMSTLCWVEGNAETQVLAVHEGPSRSMETESIAYVENEYESYELRCQDSRISLF
jgi:hypothetical protein